MQTSRVERPEQLTIEVGRWSASLTTIAVTLVFVLVVGMLANSVRKNNGRAEDWHRRAVAAEEIVGGLKVVIAERSRALNERTRQANQLVATVHSSRGAVGTLTRRQRQLATDKARVEAELRKLRAQRSALQSVASALSTCSQGLESLASRKPKVKPATARSSIARCDRAQASFRAVLEQLR
jgi:chromosome segregation ATPase